MLSSNDKWFMKSKDSKISRYGHEERKKRSCVRSQFAESREVPVYEEFRYNIIWHFDKAKNKIVGTLLT